MATTLESPQQTSRPRRSGGSGFGVILLGLLLIGGLAGGGWLLAGSITGGDADEAGAETMTVAVTKGTMQVQVTEDGEVESAKPVLLKCLVSGGSQILEIVPDGTRIVAQGAEKVEPTDIEVGDQLVKLDDSKIKDALDKQKITVGAAETALIEATKNLSVAKISVTEYEQGTFVQELQGLDAEVTIAEENLRGAQNQYAYTQKMFRKGFVTKLQLEADQFAVKRSNLELQQSETKRLVLVKFTKEKLMEDFKSNVQTATQSVKQKQSALSLEKRSLERIGEQFKNCIILAPQPGMVVYHNERSRYGRSSSTPIEEGATVREHQSIVKLPDFSRMQVKVSVHESKVQQVAIGDRAQLTIQGYKDALEGVVIEIANQPESTSWYQANVKEYATIVKIDTIPEGMVPGMSAEVVIDVEQREDVLRLPVGSVIEIGGEYFAWTNGGEGYVKQTLVVAKSSKGDNRVLSDSKFIGVESGVDEGDLIVLNPRDVVPEVKELIKKHEEQEAKEKKSSPAAAKKSAAPGGAGRPGAGQKTARKGSGKRSGPGGSGGGSRKGSGGAGDKRKGSGGAGGKRKGGGGGFNADSLLARMDKDKDGKISKAEVEGNDRMKSGFDANDTNKDGFLDKAELNKIVAAMRARFSSGGGGQ
jgi:HlyD family secretion protein